MNNYTDFNLVELLTTKKDKAVLVWICNIGAEKYWNGESTGVIDKKENIIVNRVEEMCLLLCRKQDVLILREMPNEAYLEFLSKAGFSIPRIICPQQSNLHTPISELVLTDDYIKNELRNISNESEEVYFVPYAVTEVEEKIADMCGLTVPFSNANISAGINDKIFSRKLAEDLKLPVCEGYTCSTLDEVKKAYEVLKTDRNFKKVIIKEPFGASGKGLFVIEDSNKLSSVLIALARTSRKRTSSKWLVEGWYEKKLDVNYQIYISANGDVKTFSIKEQILNGTVYLGSKIDSDENKITNRYIEYGELIGKMLYKCGYVGVAGIDSIITDSDEIIPIIEVNARFTLSTYISFLNGVIGDKKVMTRYYRILNKETCDYSKLIGIMESKGILYSNAVGNGVIVYTAGTLPKEMGETNELISGRVFAMYISTNWEEIDELRVKFETIINELFLNIQ